MRKEQAKLQNLDEKQHIQLEETLEPNKLSVLVQPVKPNLKARMPSIFSQNSPGGSASTGIQLNPDKTMKNLENVQPLSEQNSNGFPSASQTFINDDKERT